MLRSRVIFLSAESADWTVVVSSPGVSGASPLMSDRGRVGAGGCAHAVNPRLHHAVELVFVKTLRPILFVALACRSCAVRWSCSSACCASPLDKRYFSGTMKEPREQVELLRGMVSF